MSRIIRYTKAPDVKNQPRMVSKWRATLQAVLLQSGLTLMALMVLAPSAYGQPAAAANFHTHRLYYTRAKATSACLESSSKEISFRRSRIRATRWNECASWDAHPQGPRAIYFATGTVNYGHGNVIRYTDIYATNTISSGGGVILSRAANRFHDIIGVGYQKDLDVYGNIIPNGVDDAVEADGTAVNVRIWGNYFDLSLSRQVIKEWIVRPVLYFPEHHRPWCRWLDRKSGQQLCRYPR